MAAPRLHRVETYEAAVDVQQSVRDLYGRTLALLARAEASGDLSGALRAGREARGNRELLGRVDGSFGGPVTPDRGCYMGLGERRIRRPSFGSPVQLRHLGGV